MLKDILKHYKSSFGLSNQEIADRSKISLRTVQRLLSGELSNPTMDILVGLASCFDVPVDVLCDSYHEWIVRPDELRHVLMYRSLDDRHKAIITTQLEEAMRDWHQELKKSYYVRKRHEFRLKVDTLTIGQLEQIENCIKEKYPQILEVNEKV